MLLCSPGVPMASFMDFEARQPVCYWGDSGVPLG